MSAIKRVNNSYWTSFNCIDSLIVNFKSDTVRARAKGFNATGSRIVGDFGRKYVENKRAKQLKKHST